MKRSFYLTAFLAIALSMVFLSCSKIPQSLILNYNFSVNLAEPSTKWLDLEKFTPTQKNAYHDHGMPQNIRIWWDREGEFKTYLQVDTDIREKKYTKLKFSWVYPFQNKEILFPPGENYAVLPLTDQLKLVAFRGDPNEIEKYNDGSDVIEVWTYYDYGKIYKFRNRVKVSEQDFTPMGTYIKK